MEQEVKIISSSPGLRFEDSLNEVFQMLNEDLKTQNVIWAKVYLSDSSNQLNLLKSHPLFVDCFSKTAFSYIEQPLLNGSKIGILYCVTKCEIEVSIDGGKTIVKLPDRIYYFQSVRFDRSEVKTLTSEQQTEEAFKKHILMLQDYGLSLIDNCVRTWLYVRDIDVNYSGVVKGRNNIFEQQGLTQKTHYIASTGIEGYSAKSESLVSADFLSIQSKDMQQKYLQALDYLNPTHEYGVAFERGTSVCINDDVETFISGTASIDKKGDCIFCGDVLQQAERLFLNIEKLLEGADQSFNDLEYIIVYLRDLTDYHKINNYMQRRFSAIPFIVVKAAVCRPQWLIECECVARSKKN